jgi:hypothetical protein
MRVWVDSSDALFRAVNSLGLKKVKVEGYELIDFYETVTGGGVQFFLGDPRIEDLSGGIVVYREGDFSRS